MFIINRFCKRISNYTIFNILQFVKFGIVGLFGFAVDACTVYLLRNVIGLSSATLIAYFVAATSNWFLNRLWTFKKNGSHQNILYQWFKFISANSLGFLLNRGTVFALFYISKTCLIHPVIALAAGAVAGMFANFNLSKKLVYTDKITKKK